MTVLNQRKSAGPKEEKSLAGSRWIYRRLARALPSVHPLGLSANLFDQSAHFSRSAAVKKSDSHRRHSWFHSALHLLAWQMFAIMQSMSGEDSSNLFIRLDKTT
jgi:hypothetical protein